MSNVDVQANQVRLTSILNDGFTALSLALGARLGLVKAICEHAGEENSVSSQQLADKTQLRERYVREWLNGMSVARVVAVNAAGDRYWLTPAMSQAFASSQELMGMAVMLPLLSEAHEKVSRCFMRDGPRGTAYSDYERFHEFMAKGSEKRNTPQQIFEKLLPEIDPKTIESLNQGGLELLEIGCGQGHQAQYIATKFPKCQYTAFDFCAEPIEHANKVNKLPNLTYLQLDAKQMKAEWTSKFDFAILFDSLHDQARPDLCLKEIYRVLKPNGVLILVDIDMHSNVADNISNIMAPAFYAASLFHCMPISLNEEGGLGLGTCYGRELAQQMLKEDGFVDVVVRNIDAMNAVYVAYKPNSKL